jgi:hypothetical protein
MNAQEASLRYAAARRPRQSKRVNLIQTKKRYNRRFYLYLTPSCLR